MLVAAAANDTSANGSAIHPMPAILATNAAILSVLAAVALARCVACGNTLSAAIRAVAAAIAAAEQVAIRAAVATPSMKVRTAASCTKTGITTPRRPFPARTFLTPPSNPRQLAFGPPPAQ